MTSPVASHLSFSISRQQLQSRILIPKYYDPELAAANQIADSDFYLPLLADVLAEGNNGSRLGSWIRREHYGTGSIPYVRTSDLNNWRLRPDYKKGVSQNVYADVAQRQDVRVGDILMVAHGTYLVGSVGIVTENDVPLVLQDHVFRLRVGPRDPQLKALSIDTWLLLAALSTRFTRRQIRARQFSADIIDKIGERHLEVRVPIPRDSERRRNASDAVEKIIKEQSVLREKIALLLSSDLRMTRERSHARHGFSFPRSSLVNRIVIPKYYDPDLNEDLRQAEKISGVNWIPLSNLIEDSLLTVNTGVEVGKMAYGTGTVPFIRTTDIAELELKADPRQGISDAIYQHYAAKASVSEGDVLLIRDGTYLVGSSAIITADDLPALICGGIYRLRSRDAKAFPPHTLLGLLNLPLVRRQMRSKQFTRDVIDTLGKRLFEVRVPDPQSDFAKQLGADLGIHMAARAAIRDRMRTVINSLEPAIPRQSHDRPGWSMRS